MVNFKMENSLAIVKLSNKKAEMILHQKIKATKMEVNQRETCYMAFHPTCTQ